MFSHRIEINAPAMRVWEVLIELERFSEWNPSLIEASGTVSVGERLRIHAAGGLRFKPTVLVAEPGKELAWVGRLWLPGFADGTHRWILEEENAVTVVTQTEVFTGLLAPLVPKVMDLSRQFRASNEALKARVEEMDF